MTAGLDVLTLNYPYTGRMFFTSLRTGGSEASSRLVSQGPHEQWIPKIIMIIIIIIIIIAIIIIITIIILSLRKLHTKYVNIIKSIKRFKAIKYFIIEKLFHKKIIPDNNCKPIVLLVYLTDQLYLYVAAVSSSFRVIFITIIV